MAIIFKDVGKESEDFYSLFYSLSLFMAIQLKYGENILSIKDSIDLIERYVRSKGIGINVDISEADLTYVYENWLDEFRARGTERVYRDKQLVRGRAFEGNLLPYVNGVLGIDLGDDEVRLSFDLKESATLGVKSIFQTVSSGQVVIDTNSGAYITFNIFGSSDIDLPASYNDILKSVEILMKKNSTNWDITLIVNDVVINSTPEQISYSTINIDGVGSAALGLLSNINIQNKFISSSNTEYLFKINENGGRYYSDSLNDDVYLFDTGTSFVTITEDEDFNNVKFSQIDGEMKRLIGYEIYNEFISSLMNFGDLGWLLGKTSPSSFDIVNIPNFNKIKDSDKLKSFPFIFTGAGLDGTLLTYDGSEFIFTSTTQDLEIGDISGTDGTLPGYSDDFLIPVDNSLDYQLSMFVKIDSASYAVDFSFGVSAHESDGTRQDLPNADTVNGTSNLFIDSFDLTKYPDNWLFVRGRIHKSGYDLANDTEKILNIDGSGHLKFPDSPEITYIRPYVKLAEGASVANQRTTRFKDITLSVLESPYGQGHLSSIPTVINVVKNNSTLTDNQTDKEIDKYFNYNTIIKNKYI